MNNRSTAIGFLYLLLGGNCLLQFGNWLSISTYSLELDFVGIMISTLAAAFYFLTASAYNLTEGQWCARAVHNSQYSWYAYSSGFLVRSIAMFIGGVYYPPNILWGVLFAGIFLLCNYIGYKRYFASY